MNSGESYDRIRSQEEEQLREMRVVDALERADLKHGSVAVVLKPSALFCIVCEVQLALKFPGHAPAAAALAEKIVRDWAQALCRHVPEAEECIEEGWNRTLAQEIEDGARRLSVQLLSEVAAERAAEEAQVKEALDGLGWQETSGVSNVGNPLCPCCRVDLLWIHCTTNGTGQCPYCENYFRWQAGPSPAGFAWTTAPADCPEEERSDRNGGM